ncbi:hypothetical protein [Weissella cibaria]|uniref:Uncharacterized protein n=1 Tax=Weissella cibaria TaxID=137591 RepID=A0A2S1KRR1_9LACO|nr:hypothetical protein [Weissella cibaria]AWF95707.1 hypothetical protein B6254_1303 [Weissella cibaria]MDH5011807.1 hypothetical protein [Weissella cibaria]
MHTQVETPAAIYELTITPCGNQVTLMVVSDTLPTVTQFALTTSDESLATYFSNYLNGLLALHFQPKMANATFISELEKLISTVLVNWQNNTYPLPE